MRTTVTIDDKLLGDAEEYSGITEHSALIKEALGVLVEREASKRARRLSGERHSPGAKRRGDG